MKRFLAKSIAVASVLCASGSIASGDESAFLQSLDGSWGGNGTVKVRADASPMNVTCTFQSDTIATSLSLGGSCTGLVVFSRISADLKADGGLVQRVLCRRWYRYSRSRRAARRRRHQPPHQVGERGKWRPQGADDH